MTHVSLTSILTLRLTVEVAERLKDLGLFDVMALPIELQQLYTLRTDPHRLLRVLFEMLDQARCPLTLEQLTAQLTDDAVYLQMWEAFTREVTDFSRGPMRAVIAEVFRMLETAEAERVACLTATILRSLHEIAANSLGVSSGGSPESPESIPDLSHCDNLTIWPPDADETNGADTRNSARSPPTATAPPDSPLLNPQTSTPTETLPES